MAHSYDLVGCGFGPANLAIAVAIADKWLESDKDNSPLQRICFIEKHPRFLWHPGMLLPGTLMQISFLKDLATLRNPSSSFSFLSYLHAHSRLLDFINKGSFTPTRREFADYLTWASERIQDLGIQVAYNEELVALHRSDDGSQIQCVSIQNGERIVRTTKNLIIAPGGAPRIPSEVTSVWPCSTVFHTSTYAMSITPVLESLKSIGRPLRVAVLGSGQSAAEAFLDCHDRLSSLQTSSEVHELDLIIRKGSLKPSDDSPFANEIFNPDSTNSMYDLPNDRSRNRVLQEYKNTNYGVVNPRTLENLYEHFYNQKLEKGIETRITRAENISTAISHLRILSYQSVIGMTTAADGHPFVLTLQHTLTREVTTSKPYDIIILGTGYERNTHLKLLESSELGATFGIKQDDSIASSLVSFGTISNYSTQSSSPSTPVSMLDSFTSSNRAAPCTPQLNISRAYRLQPVDQFQPRIYLQGCSESTHGLSDTLLSVLSIRAGEIVEDILSDN